MVSTVSHLCHSVGVRYPSDGTRGGASVGAGSGHIETLSEIEVMQSCPPTPFGSRGMVDRKRMAFG